VVLTHLCPQERQTLKTLKPADGQYFLNETTIRQNEKTSKKRAVFSGDFLCF